MSIDDLRNALRELGRIYRHSGREQEAIVCKKLVKALMKDAKAPDELSLPGWLDSVLKVGFTGNQELET